MILFLLLLPAAYAIEDFSSNSWLDMQLAISSNIRLVETGPNPIVTFLTAELFLYPIASDSQLVSNVQFISNPTAQVQRTQNNVVYKWTRPGNSINLGLESAVRVSSDIPKIILKIAFPINNLNYTYLVYTQPVEMIDITPAIREKANEIVSGEDDLYDATFKIADWVSANIQYNLTTLTEKIVPKSSWVLENKEGVCDEITSLFISMLRSIGIPARFVSGVAYTNIEDTWGNHGWAEVYFPGYGWIPFDVTYKQFGWVDPSHIVLQYSIDSSVPSLTLSGEMSGVQFSDTNINIKTNLITKSAARPSMIRMELEPLIDEAGPGSYVPVRIRLENLQPYYIPVQLKVTKAPGLTEDNVKGVLLKPNQEKSAFWILEIPREIKENYLYSTIFEVINSYGGVEATKINYGKNYGVVSLDEADLLIQKYAEQEELTYSENIDIDCKPEKPYYFDYEQAVLICDIKNIGNLILKDINVCINSNCQSVSLHISESKKTRFEDIAANKDLEVSATNGNINFKETFSVKSLSDPHLAISNIKYPEKILYNGIADIQFTLASEAPVKNVQFVLNGNEFYTLQSFSNSEERVFTIKGKYFYSDTGIAKLIVNYEDENGYKYTNDKSFLVKVENVPFYVEILTYFKNLF